MKHSFYIAWKYIQYHRIKSFILLLSMSLTATIPLGLHYLLAKFDQQLHVRAQQTPLIVGSKGSSLDLSMNSLYFSGKTPELMKYSEVERIDSVEGDLAIPIYSRFKSKKIPIIGTSADYFDLRKLSFSQGSGFAVLGDCVIGSDLAKELSLKVGDTIDSSPENAFDFGGVYPLRMNIRGILNKSASADDRAIFCDVLTCWVIEGLGHGHEDLKKAKSSVVLKKEGKNTVANASLYNYNTISADNLKGFHFHGDMSEFPISSILVFPKDTKNRDLLMGKYISGDLQVLKPTKVFNELIEQLLNAEKFFFMIFSLVLVAVILMGILVILLSLRLRKNEISTMYHLGCQKFKTLEVLLAEILILTLIAAVLTAVLCGLIIPFENLILQEIF